MWYFLLRMVFFFPSIQSEYIIWSPINEISSVGIQVGVSPASWKCSEEFFSHQIKNRDPLKLGFVCNFSCFCWYQYSYFVTRMLLFTSVMLINLLFFSIMAADFQIFGLCG